MAEYKSIFEIGEKVYLVNTTKSLAPLIREFTITRICWSAIMPPHNDIELEYTAYETEKGPASQWWRLYEDEKNIFHTRAKAEQCLEYLREIFKDDPLEMMPYEIGKARVEEAENNFVALYGRG